MPENSSAIVQARRTAPGVRIPVISDGLDALSGGVSGAIDGVQAVGSAVSMLGDPVFWQRVAKVVAGVALVMAGAGTLGLSSALSSSAVQKTVGAVL